MSSSRLAFALGVVVLLPACSADIAPVIEVTAHAAMPVILEPTLLVDLGDDATYRWDLVTAPVGSRAEVPQGEPIATFLPDVRGTYLVERWIGYGVADDLSYRFLINAKGSPPVAVINVPASVSVGTTVTLDGQTSHSPEGRDLIFQWRLLERPRDSQATIADAGSATTSFAADVVGNFVIELHLFDGGLWNEAPTPFTIHVFP